MKRAKRYPVVTILAKLALRRVMGACGFWRPAAENLVVSLTSFPPRIGKVRARTIVCTPGRRLVVQDGEFKPYREWPKDRCAPTRRLVVQSYEPNAGRTLLC